MKTNPNDPVNPIEVGFENGEIQQFRQISNHTAQANGLTKREYFAAMAMQGLIMWNKAKKIDPGTIAMLSTTCADSLINELNRK